MVFTVKYSSIVTCISGLFCCCVMNWLYYKKHSCWDFSPAESWGLWIVELQRVQHKISQRILSNLITTIPINTLYNLEQVCQNFSLALLDLIKCMSVRHLSHKFKITKVAKIKLSAQCQQLAQQKHTILTKLSYYDNFQMALLIARNCQPLKSGLEFHGKLKSYYFWKHIMWSILKRVPDEGCGEIYWDFISDYFITFQAYCFCTFRIMRHEL